MQDVQVGAEKTLDNSILVLTELKKALERTPLIVSDVNGFTGTRKINVCIEFVSPGEKLTHKFE